MKKSSMAIQMLYVVIGIACFIGEVIGSINGEDITTLAIAFWGLMILANMERISRR